MDTLTASQALKRLRDKGLLAQKGRGSATWYQPTDRMLGIDVLSTNPASLSTNPVGLSTNIEDDKRRALLNELPGALAARVGAIGQRHPPQQVQELIVLLCAQRPFGAEELATLIGRNARYIRQNYLRPLLRAGRIQKTNPDKPNDPEQAYISIENS